MHLHLGGWHVNWVQVAAFGTVMALLWGVARRVKRQIREALHHLSVHFDDRSTIIAAAITDPITNEVAVLSREIREFRGMQSQNDAECHMDREALWKAVGGRPHALHHDGRNI